MQRSIGLVIILLSALWGASFLFLNIAVVEAGPAATTWIRLGIAAMALGLYVIYSFGVSALWQGWSLSMWAVALLGSAVPFALFSYAAQHLPAGYLSVLNATAPMQGLVLGILWFSQPSAVRLWVGVLAGFFGVFYLMSLGPVFMGNAQWLAVGAGLGAAFCYALVAYLVVRWFSQGNKVILSWQMQAASTVLLTPWVIVAPPDSWFFRMETWGALVMVGLFCTAVAYILYFRILQQVGAVQASVIGFLIPCFALLWSVLFLDELLSTAHFLGILFIAIAVWCIRPKT